jgi:hypothetical protein
MKYGVLFLSGLFLSGLVFADHTKHLSYHPFFEESYQAWNVFVGDCIRGGDCARECLLASNTEMSTWLPDFSKFCGDREKVEKFVATVIDKVMKGSPSAAHDNWLNECNQLNTSPMSAL